jgi:DNA repair photolyase
MEQDSWIQLQDADVNAAKERSDFFMRPEPRENMSAISVEQDDFLQRPMKVRTVRIGMTRNAVEENKQEVKAYLEPFPHIRIDTAKPLQGWYKSLHEPEGVRARPCFSEAILTEPYGGYCAVGCQFCYVNSGFRGYRGTGLITVPLNYGQQVRKQLSKMYVGAAGYFSSFTDPFTPLESYYHNTEEAAREFVAVGLPIFFLSRLRYPEWAMELLTKNPHSYAQKSINTCDARDWQLLSPGALPLKQHLSDIRKLRDRNIYVSIQCNPIIAGVTTHAQIERLFGMLADAGANHVIVKFVEAGYSWAPAMVERIKKRFGAQRGGAFESLFTENIGGQRTIVEEYRMAAHDRYRERAIQLGLTYATCYEYRKTTKPSGKVDNVGVSIGREYTTSEQCHGQRVPVYKRDSLDKPFEPMDECPPSGCLYCASENDGEARCGSELLGSATAMRAADYKKPLVQLSL